MASASPELARFDGAIAAPSSLTSQTAVRSAIAQPDAIVFFVALLVSLVVVQIGWDHPLLDLHSFRQCQTAISTYYALEGGFQLAYLTPVLGKPWSIPLEFPLYQWLVAAVVIVTSMPIDEAGRLVAVCFFYGTLFPAYKFLSLFLSRDRLLVLAVYVCSPVYLYWSRTFMIESTALFWSLSFMTAAAYGMIRNHYRLLALAAVCGAIAGPVKVTTFAVFLGATSLLLLHLWMVQPSPIKRRRLFHYLCAGVLLFAVPVLATKLWTNFADAQKTLNPMAQGLLSYRSNGWNFGTLAQRISPHYWWRVWERSIPYLLGGPALLVLPLSALLLQKGQRKAILLCLVAFAAGPIVFFNLYQEHEYYWYANGIFLLFAVGLSLAALAAVPEWRKIVYVAVVPTVMLVLLTSYANKLYPWQKVRGDQFLTLAEAVQQVTPREAVLLVYGFEWSSALPYYSKRRALMDYRDKPLDDPEMAGALEQLRDEPITCLVVGRRLRSDAAFVRERIARFQLQPEPVIQHPLADVYIR